VLEAAGRSMNDRPSGEGPPPFALRNALASWLRAAAGSGRLESCRLGLR
jgi:hypothetical protein